MRILPALILLMIWASTLSYAQSNYQDTGRNVVVYLFWSKTCPHCAKEKPFMEQLEVDYPNLKVHYLEISENASNAELYSRMADACGQKPLGVPATFINGEMVLGFSDEIALEIKSRITDCFTKDCIDPISKLQAGLNPAENKTCENKNSIKAPILGEIDPTKMSLPVFTLVIASLDSINPCAFFVLFFLLSLLVYAQSRRRMLLIGGIFVFFSAFIYFIFMTAWLNFFLFVGELKAITIIAGVLAIAISLINIREFFLGKGGVSLSIPESAKPKLFTRMRNLVKASQLTSMLFGTVILAIAANTYELLCTAGFPMVYTRVLTLNNLTTVSYYAYLILYNIIYVVPLFLIVVMFTLTLGSRKLREEEGRMLKLLSGFMMLFLGGILVFAPAMLNDIIVAITILALSVGLTTLFTLFDIIENKRGKKPTGRNPHHKKTQHKKV